MRRSPGSGGQLAAVAAVLAICILFPAPASASLSKYAGITLRLMQLSGQEAQGLPVLVMARRWKNYVGGAYGTVPNTTIGYGEEMYRGFYVLDANPDYVVGKACPGCPTRWSCADTSSSHDALAGERKAGSF
jgi:hypothetical protein